MALCCATSAHAKAVFAHFMVGNVPSYQVADWQDDIRLAAAAGIDGFALNMASKDESIPQSITKAFEAAAPTADKFKLFFSFDYEAQGPWPKQAVIDLVNKYKANPAYHQHVGKDNKQQPLVSTFEGAGSSGDWTDIKARTGAFFVPDWSSVGAPAAVAKNIVDGLFSWEAWPNGEKEMTTAPDEAYRAALGRDRVYMMPVSPWFYTNLPGWNKNWVWRGDSLWYDRWEHVLAVQPEYVQIITWNDYGESQYIGPVRETGLGLFDVGKAPMNYVRNMPHDGWRVMLPWVIEAYKTGKRPAVKEDEEKLVVWYRKNPGTSGSDGGTTGNNKNHGQVLMKPGQLLHDRVYFSALLAKDAEVSVTIGGKDGKSSWSDRPDTKIGMFHGSVPFDGRLGEVIVSVKRDGKVVKELKGVPITASCEGGLVNWNAWVGSA